MRQRSISCVNNKENRMRKSITDISQNIDNISSSCHVDSLILDGVEHGDHGDHVHPNLISQRQHGFGRELPQRTSLKTLG